jgi:hypothetical protein
MIETKFKYTGHQSGRRLVMSIIEGERPYDVYLTTKNDTIGAIAKKVKCIVEDLVELNRDQQWVADSELAASTTLKDGTTVLLPCSAKVSAQEAKGYRGSDALKWVDPCMCFAVIKRNIDKGVYDGDDGASCLPESFVTDMQTSINNILWYINETPMPLSCKNGHFEGCVKMEKSLRDIVEAERRTQNSERISFACPPAATARTAAVAPSSSSSRPPASEPVADAAAAVTPQSPPAAAAAAAAAANSDNGTALLNARQFWKVQLELVQEKVIKEDEEIAGAADRVKNAEAQMSTLEEEERKLLRAIAEVKKKLERVKSNIKLVKSNIEKAKEEEATHRDKRRAEEAKKKDGEAALNTLCEIFLPPNKHNRDDESDGSGSADPGGPAGKKRRAENA